MLARIRKMVDEREEGFTLIELLVVIIIIGILAAIAIPVFLSQRQKGYDAQAKSDARNAATIEETYLTDYNYYQGAASFTGNANVPPALAFEGLKVSANDTAMQIVTFAPGTPPTVSATTTATAGYCIQTTSSSGKLFWYDSQAGGFVTASCLTAL